MKLACVCVTYLRPHLLGQVIESFQRQTYQNRELIILDDAGQYEDQSGDRWRIVSVPHRFQNLGAKRNACAALASTDVDAFVVTDDDDIYLPHWLEAHAEALRRGDWSRPSLVLVEDGGNLKEIPTTGVYHGGWAYRRELFEKAGGYPDMNSGEDQALGKRMIAAGAKIVDPCEFAEPFYFYRDTNHSYHLSWRGQGAEPYNGLAPAKPIEKAVVNISWPRDFTKVHVSRLFCGGFAKLASDGLKMVELIGPQVTAERNGPTNGMYALQRALKKRIDAGLDWLTIKSLPVTRGSIPWFWNWADRTVAKLWDESGQPWVEGPNILFTHSAHPRGNDLECAMLDAVNLKAMFCHSAWYKEHIEKYKGPSNKAPVHTWPYPIDPWPGEPLPDEYDLLIYAKNGNRPGLLEDLAKRFPRHVQIHYGQYRRQELFEAARRSKACAYLADDDHGPLGLQEILLAGCPVIGVRTGASLIEEGVTGTWVKRLPPGEHCCKTDDDHAALEEYVSSLTRLMTWDRKSVRSRAAEVFDTEKIVDRVIALLQEVRREVSC